MYIVASAPKTSRGTVNGLSQTTASIVRAVGPALSTSLLQPFGRLCGLRCLLCVVCFCFGASGAASGKGMGGS
ncbi:hypothetical protein B0H10DRAFT_2066810 [Mycena sp. CBHHK59/15]|nr:hypothetical protein B0H10DRAFT_2066810 [Mycena sp. CBHHK59/15]